MVTDYELPNSDSQPDGITTGPDGALWFAEYNGNRIGRITTAGVITEYTLPTPKSLPTWITPGPDGALWFTEFGGRKIGRITTGGSITEYATQNLTSAPDGITAAPDGALWFTEFGGGRIGRITTTGVITEYPVSTQQTSQPNLIVPGPDGALWFPDSVSAHIGRAPVCALAFSAGFSGTTLTLNFDLGIDTPATLNIIVADASGTPIGEPFSRAISPTKPLPFTLHWTPFPNLGKVTVAPRLISAPGQVICSEWTTVNTAP